MARKRTPGVTRKGTPYEHTKPWKAAVKVHYREHFLGNFHTKEEAERVEEEFRLLLFGSRQPRRKPIIELLWGDPVPAGLVGEALRNAARSD